MQQSSTTHPSRDEALKQTAQRLCVEAGPLQGALEDVGAMLGLFVLLDDRVAIASALETQQQLQSLAAALKGYSKGESATETLMDALLLDIPASGYRSLLGAAMLETSKLYEQTLRHFAADPGGVYMQLRSVDPFFADSTATTFRALLEDVQFYPDEAYVSLAIEGERLLARAEALNFLEHYVLFLEQEIYLAMKDLAGREPNEVEIFDSFVRLMEALADQGEFPSAEVHFYANNAYTIKLEGISASDLYHINDAIDMAVLAMETRKGEVLPEMPSDDREFEMLKKLMEDIYWMYSEHLADGLNAVEEQIAQAIAEQSPSGRTSRSAA